MEVLLTEYPRNRDEKVLSPKDFRIDKLIEIDKTVGITVSPISNTICICTSEYDKIKALLTDDTTTT